MIYFTADTHFGHANIVKMCQRPYPDKMVEQLKSKKENDILETTLSIAEKGYL